LFSIGFATALAATGCGRSPQLELGNDGEAGPYDAECDMVVTPVGWTESTSFYLTAEQAFAGADGTCTAPLTWDGSVFAPTPIDPPGGTSDVEVTVAIDTESARLTTFEPLVEGALCDPGYLEVDGTAWLATADGMFDESGAITIAAAVELDEIDVSDFTVDLAEMGGALQIGPLADGESGALRFRIGSLANGCVGEVYLAISESLGGGVGSTGSGRLAEWSSTGCGVGETSIDLSSPTGDNPPVLEMLEATWGDLAIPATWEGEGFATDLGVTVEITDPIACMSDPIARVDAVATYETLDGRLGPRTTPANLEVSIDSDGVPWHSGIRLNDEIACASATDEIPYSFGDCAALQSILVQLGLEFTTDGEGSAADEGLTIYEFDRDGAGPSGPPDRLRVLSLTL
jgi:hypothetical protein